MKERLNHWRRILAHPAHRAEQPLHIVYLLSVGWYAGGVYGGLAVICGIVTIIGMGEPPHAV